MPDSDSLDSDSLPDSDSLRFAGFTPDSQQKPDSGIHFGFADSGSYRTGFSGFGFGFGVVTEQVFPDSDSDSA